ncbi:PVC-type heme-binding CxxCH protein [uncultured Cyclobacterium sp.]|uniref:PVC-type heme-binding CxxCH protein n=1 Tax=uncultured Cyclobacterium sp. TaxID=453820 RepID=UPI0030EDF5DA|tara:strand:- start:1611 stop:4364 length:2754 start_codon:yes stop_codon:yes gene_type:complete
MLFVPEGLEVNVWAESPLFYNPTNMDVDAKGRLWITEGVNYRDFRNADGHKVQDKGDRIMILEDTNGDGKADASKVFVQDTLLRSPLGIAVLGNQVIVSCSPNVIIYTDEDGDDIPDSKEIFLSGFGGKDHDHGLHAGQLGPDGKWYFITGNAGPHQVAGKDGWTLRSGSVYNEYTPYSTENLPSQISDDGQIYNGGLVIRINPDGTDMEVVSHNFRNAFEVAVDSYGNMWQSDNDDQTASCRTTWLMEGSNAGYFSEKGDRTWQADRRPGQTIAEAHWHQHDPGVLPVGDVYGAGSPTGMVRIEEDELGEQFRGLLLSADAGRNIIFGYQPEVKGAGYPLQNRQAFVSSVDQDNTGYIWHQVEEDTRKWFRPSDVTVGTDGSLFIADWYDPIVGGHQMRDTVGEGKIYRIVPKDKKLTVPKIDFSTTEGQLIALKNPAVHVRAFAMQKLKEQGAAVLPELENIIQNGDNPFYKARAIWTIAGMGEQGIHSVLPLLKDANQEIVLTTLRALATYAPDQLLEKGLMLANESSPLIRRELALLLRDEDWEKTSEIYEELVNRYDGIDPWYRNALGIGMKDNAETYYGANVASMDPAKWSSQIASLVWEWHPKAAIPALKARVENKDLEIDERDLALETLAFIFEKEAVEAVKLAAETEGVLGEKAQWWLQFRKYNEWSTFLQDWDSQIVLPDAQPDLLALKAQLKDSLSNQEQKHLTLTQLAENPVGRLHLALMGAEGLFKNEELDFSAVTKDEKRPSVLKVLRHYFGGDQAIDEEEILALGKDPVAGKVKAIQNCAACHRIAGSGNEIGPDLSQIGQKMDYPTLVNTIAEPDAAIGFGSEAYLIALKNGAVLLGLLQAAGPVVTVLDFQGKRHVLPAEEVLTRKQLRISLMPGPLEMDLKAQDIADIAAFLIQSHTSN